MTNRLTAELRKAIECEVEVERSRSTKLHDTIGELRAEIEEWKCEAQHLEIATVELRVEVERLRAAAISVVNYHLRGCGSLSPARDPVVMAHLIEELDRALAGPPKRSEGREGK